MTRIPIKFSIWYRLTPIEQNLLVLQPAVFFFDTVFAKNKGDCETDTTERVVSYNPDDHFFDPHYRIVFPNGGETFKAGDQCNISITAARHGNATINISFDLGKSWMLLPGLNHSIDPMNYSIIVFNIPDSVFDGESMVSTASSQCLLKTADYGNSNYYDKSDKPFTILESK